VPHELVERLLDAAILAPSGKNAQPWRFVALEGARKREVTRAMLEQVRRVAATGLHTGSASLSARIMAQAPMVILVYHRPWLPEGPTGEAGRYLRLVDAQSVGAAIQNMLLAATELGLGSLWICDVFFAERQIGELVGRTEDLFAAVAVGYPRESPPPRPRKPWAEITDFLAGGSK
jgi:nitroreductase